MIAGAGGGGGGAEEVRVRRRNKKKGGDSDAGDGEAAGADADDGREWDDGGALEEAFYTMKTLRSELPDLFPQNITREEAHLAQDLSRASCNIIPPLPSIKFKLNAGLWKVLREELERAERGSDEDTASEDEGVFGKEFETGPRGERHWSQVFSRDEGSDRSDYEDEGPRLAHKSNIKGIL